MQTDPHQPLLQPDLGPVDEATCEPCQLLNPPRLGPTLPIRDELPSGAGSLHRQLRAGPTASTAGERVPAGRGSAGGRDIALAATPLVARNRTSGLGRVAWTRGRGCLPLAERLDDGPATAISGDLRRSCVEGRIDLLVARRVTSFDLVPTVVPHGIEFDKVTAITAAVGDGPHSPLAAAVAARLADSLGVPGEVATVYRTDEEIPAATQRLNRLGRDHPGLGRRAANESTAVKLINTLTPSTLLVVGAPGGSWFQRQIYGPGHRLLAAAPAGAIVVHSAPRRCYQVAVDPAGVAIGPHLAVADALRVVTQPVVPVAVDGQLVGILRATALHEAPPHMAVAEVMEPPVAVTAAEPACAADELSQFLDHGPVPVVDHTGRLVGVIPPGMDHLSTGWPGVT